MDKNIPDSLKYCLGIELKNSNFYSDRVYTEEAVVNVAVVNVVWRHVLKMISLIKTLDLHKSMGTVCHECMGMRTLVPA